MKNENFVDWITASQLYPKGGLPVLSGGLIVFYDAQGLPRSERNQSAGITGSHDSRIRVGCDGFRVSISGNVGRFSRQDNLYNFGWEGTKQAVNRILADIGLPVFTGSKGIKGEADFQRGAVVSRLDITCNYATGNELLARAVIAWLATRSMSRMKRGNSGDESVWFANTRHMIKAYIKHLEMLAHGCEDTDKSYLYAKELGLLRIELELKKRLLGELKMNDWDDITQEKLESVFRESTSFLNEIDTSYDNFTLLDVPESSRIYASAWLAGQDLRALLKERTFYRQAKILRDCGLDVYQKRAELKQFPIKARVIDLKPTVAPDWYVNERNHSGLRLVA